MRARTVNDPLSPVEKREEVMKILTDRNIQVPSGSYVKFHDLSLTDLSPEEIVDQLIKEAYNFERGQNPKKSLDIGGITLENKLEERVEDLEYEIAMLTKGVSDEWTEWLRETFIGKTITAKMQHHPSMNMETKKSSPSKGSGEFTIKVKDIIPGTSIEEMLNKENYAAPVKDQKIMVVDPDNNIYSIKVSDKIFIE
jgi:hypothetical protein